MSNLFINPYNFVQPGKPSERKPYVSHKKFSGLSGVIQCKITTLTPIFTPDPKTTEPQMQPDGKKKRDMKFFRINNRPAIPASSLKGMIRSVAEAVSNSCFSVFDDSKMLYRDIEKAGIIKRNEDGKWWIWEVEEVVTPGLNITGGDGDKIWFRTQGEDRRGRKKAVDYCEHETSECTENGILKAYRKGISGKIPGGFRIAILKYNKDGSPKKYEVLDHVIETYFDVIKHPEFSSEETTSKGKEYLEKIDDNFVYFISEDDSKVKSFGKNFRYKWLKENSAADLLRRDNPEFLPCTSRDNLCVCCRMFGMIGEKKAQEDQKAFAGRVFFNDAELDGSPPEMIQDVRLRILGQPRPKYNPFYLIGESRTTHPVKRYDESNSRLRGRKFYWHHPKDSEYYKEPQGNWNDKNAQVELLPANADFSFTIEFMNLDEDELGLLLYSLELDGAQGKMAHKIGIGKPIGLGSVKITLDRNKSRIESNICRYRSSQREVESNIDYYINKFKEYLKTHNGKNSFDDIPNINDLKQMLNTGTLSAQVTYPPVPKKYKPEEGFRWFVEDKKESPLPIPSDIRKNKNMLQEH